MGLKIPRFPCRKADETTNLVNQKIYRGKHITSDLNDGYLGSGIHLQSAIQKYGAQNFKREILFMASSAANLAWVEKNIFVTLDWVQSVGKFCYNKKVGGLGGWYLIDANGSEIHLMNTEDSSKRKQDTCMKKYGVKHQFHSVEFQDKLNTIFLSKFGAARPLSSPIIQQKIKETVLTRYGVSNVSYIPEVKQKIKDSLKKYYAENNSPIIGKKCYYDPADSTRFGFYSVEDVPCGWMKGNPILKGREVYYNPTTNESKRFFPIDIIPMGFIKGGRPRKQHGTNQ